MKTEAKTALDFRNDLQTPAFAAKYMVSLIPDGVITVLEPTPGSGNIVRELTGYHVTAPADFFQLDIKQRFDCVVMNPPFSSKYAFNVPEHLNKHGMRLGYHILQQCMQMSDNVIALMPWFTISDSDVRMRALKNWGLVSLTALPRKTFQFARIQTCVFELQKGYKGATIFKVHDLLSQVEQPEIWFQESSSWQDRLIPALDLVNKQAERSNEIIRGLIMEMNPECSTYEEVEAKLNPPKKIQETNIILSMEALDVLRQCVVVDNIVKLPAVKLDRKDYELIKKKLELIGGKWKGGKVQGFVFPEDPTELLQDISNGENRDLKKEFQFFPTPGVLARQMMDHLPEPENQTCEDAVLEPSGGDGALIRAFHQYIGRVVPVDTYELMELNRKRLQKIEGVTILGEDFLKCDRVGYYDIIIANPPFTKNQDIDHIYKMFEVCKPGGTIITMASPSWTFGSQKKQVQFREWLQSLNAYTEEIPENTFRESGTSLRTVLIVISKPHASAIELLTEKQAS